MDRCFAGERTMLSSAPRLIERLRELSAQVNAAVHPGAPVAVSFCRPYEKLQPGDILPASLVVEGSLTALPGEHRAIGLMLANGADTPTLCTLRVEGLPDGGVDLSIRKQCFMENWYTKERERVADPLTLLANEAGAWATLLQRGEVGGGLADIHQAAGRRGARIHGLPGAFHGLPPGAAATFTAPAGTTGTIEATYDGVADLYVYFVELAHRAGVECIATNNVHYASPAQRKLAMAVANDLAQCGRRERGGTAVRPFGAAGPVDGGDRRPAPEGSWPVSEALTRNMGRRLHETRFAEWMQMTLRDWPEMLWYLE